jgi:hypothetical protein
MNSEDALVLLSGGRRIGFSAREKWGRPSIKRQSLLGFGHHRCIVCRNGEPPGSFGY